MARSLTPSSSKSARAVTSSDTDFFQSGSALGYRGGDTNLYRYVGNNPTNATDPSGLQEQPPQGTRENGYIGLGTWKFATEAKALDFFHDLLKPEKNNLPKNWVEVVRDGCIGLNLVRIGWAGLPQKPPNAFFMPGAVFFTTVDAGDTEFKRVTEANPDKTYLFIAAQMPTLGNGKTIAKSLGTGPITVKTPGLKLDLNRMAHYNFSTWFPTKTGGGYWEFMNHHWKTFDPRDLPEVKHANDLPDLGKEFLWLYGVVEQRPWTK